jgi:hypothetical protein
MQDKERRIAAYHPEIAVRKGAFVVTIQADLADWYEDGEVLAFLSYCVGGARTVGELVEKIEKLPSFPQAEGSIVLGVRILGCEAVPRSASNPPRDWDEPI